jgi:MFS family permease
MNPPAPCAAPTPNHPPFWPLVLVAAAILMVTMGARQSMGLFVAPIQSSTGLTLVSISFALAVGQFVWGAAQPICGLMADRWGPTAVLVGGGLLLAGGTALTPFVQSEWAMTMTLGVLMAAGAGAGSFSILIGATAHRLAPERRAFAAGFINAGGSFGQFVFAPLNQALISALGWMQALWSLALISLATLPLAFKLGGKRPAAPAPLEQGLGAQLRQAFADRSYWCLHLGFFTCGFHIAFLVTHLPGEVGLCGLPAGVAATSLAVIGISNIAGSLAAGAAGSRWRMKYILFWMYDPEPGRVHGRQRQQGQRRGHDQPAHDGHRHRGPRTRCATAGSWPARPPRPSARWGASGAPPIRRWHPRPARRCAVLLDLVDQDHRVAHDHAHQRDHAQQRHEAERPVQQQQRRRHAGNAQRPGQEHQHGATEAVQLQHQQREGDEQHDRHPGRDGRRALAALLHRAGDSIR